MQTTSERDLAAMLMDLANLYPSTDSIARLRKKWPGLLPDEPVGITYNVRFARESGEPVAIDLPESLHWIVWLQQIVRSLWSGHPGKAVLNELEHILLSGKIGAKTRTAFTKLWHDASDDPLAGIIGIDWKHGTFVYRPQTVLQQALNYLLRHSRKAKVCANPDCQAPYFIAPRSNTRYCSSDCVEAMQQQAKKEWWARSGEAWRKGRQMKTNTGKRGK